MEALRYPPKIHHLHTNCRCVRNDLLQKHCRHHCIFGRDYLDTCSYGVQGRHICTNDNDRWGNTFGYDQGLLRNGDREAWVGWALVQLGRLVKFCCLRMMRRGQNEMMRRPSGERCDSRQMMGELLGVFLNWNSYVDFLDLW